MKGPANGSAALAILMTAAFAAEENEFPCDLSSLPSGGVHFSVEAVLLPASIAQRILPPEKSFNLPPHAQDAGQLYAELIAQPEAVVYDKGECRLESDQTGVLRLRPAKRSQVPGLDLHLIAHRHRGQLSYALAAVLSGASGATANARLTLGNTALFTCGTKSAQGTDDSPRLLRLDAPPQAPESTLCLRLTANGIHHAPEVCLPKLNLNWATLPEALATLRRLSRQHDPAGKGLNIVLDTWDREEWSHSIIIELADVPCSEALRYVAELAGFRLIWEAHAAWLGPLTSVSIVLSQSSFELPKELAAALQTIKPEDWLYTRGVLDAPLTAQPDSGRRIEFDAAGGRLTLRALDRELIRAQLLLTLLDAHTPPALPSAWKSAQAIRLPQVRIENSDLPRALAEVERLAARAATRKPPPTLILHAKALDREQQTVINLDLRDIPLSDVLRYLAMQSRLCLQAKGDTLIFTSYFSR